MPIYEYECEHGHRTELIVDISENGIGSTNCSECGGRSNKIMSSSHLGFPNLPKFMDAKHNHRTELQRQENAEKIYKEERNNG